MIFIIFDRMRSTYKYNYNLFFRLVLIEIHNNGVHQIDIHWLHDVL